MIDPVFNSGNYELAKKLLDASALRQEAISSNLAKSETPGYQRVDVSPDFASQLKAQISTGSSTSDLSSLQPKLATDTTARSIRPDGNSVDVDHELLAMNQNSVEYSYLSDTVTWNIKQLRMAITGVVS